MAIKILLALPHLYRHEPHFRYFPVHQQSPSAL
jgi:hypothetical protein